ncbi:MAG: hypothetical protein Q8Q06_02715 [bacterium]|nr:hypothetical protein [bacterium]
MGWIADYLNKKWHRYKRKSDGLPVFDEFIVPSVDVIKAPFSSETPPNIKEKILNAVLNVIYRLNTIKAHEVCDPALRSYLVAAAKALRQERLIFLWIESSRRIEYPIRGFYQNHNGGMVIIIDKFMIEPEMIERFEDTDGYLKGRRVRYETLLEYEIIKRAAKFFMFFKGPGLDKQTEIFIDTVAGVCFQQIPIHTGEVIDLEQPPNPPENIQDWDTFFKKLEEATDKNLNKKE